MAKRLIELLRTQFPHAVLEAHSQHGDETVVVEASRWRAVAAFLREAPGADLAMLTDLTAVDYPEREPRFEIVAHLYSLSLGHRLRLKARVGKRDGTGAEIDSLTDVWESANWLERECWDLFGVRFLGHPDLRRILLYPEFEGHPLRKDFPADKIQPLVPFRGAEGAGNFRDPGKLAPFGPDEGMPFGRKAASVLQQDDE